MSRTVVVLPGDGVGPEVTAQARAVLEAACAQVSAEVTFKEHLIGGAAIDAEGTPLPEATLNACRAADAVLLGAVGGPNWDHLQGEQRCEAGLLGLRSGLGVFANLRPVRVHPSLTGRSALRPEIVTGVDLVIVRELTGGVYFGTPKGRSGSGADETAVDTLIYTRPEIERVVRLAAELAQSRSRRLISVDKANVLASSRLWRDVVDELRGDYPDVEFEHRLVDSFAMTLVDNPRSADVVVTENMFGDILSDEAAVVTGSLGLLPSASLGASAPGLYEPIHGSAPSIAGQGIANPVGAILSAAMALRHSLQLPQAAAAVEAAVDRTIASGLLTADLGGSATTGQVGEAVLAALEASIVTA
jgi:3-isopropylmalate dehydrogenase